MVSRGRSCVAIAPTRGVAVCPSERGLPNITHESLLCVDASRPQDGMLKYRAETTASAKIRQGGDIEDLHDHHPWTFSAARRPRPADQRDKRIRNSRHRQTDVGSSDFDLVGPDTYTRRNRGLGDGKQSHPSPALSLPPPPRRARPRPLPAATRIDPSDESDWHAGTRTCIGTHPYRQATHTPSMTDLSVVTSPLSHGGFQ